MTQSSGLGARIVASVVATKFGTAFSVFVCRGGLVGAGAACTPTATANSSVVVSSNCLVGRVINPSLGFERRVFETLRAAARATSHSADAEEAMVAHPMPR